MRSSSSNDNQSLNKILDAYEVEQAPKRIVDDVMNSLDARLQVENAKTQQNVVRFKPKRVFVGSGFAIAAAIMIFMLFGQFSQPNQMLVEPVTITKSSTEPPNQEEVLDIIIGNLVETLEEEELYLSSFEELYTMEAEFQNETEQVEMLFTELLADEELSDSVELEEIDYSDDIDLWDTYFLLTDNYDL
jgi:hypothetical protein